MSTQDADCHTPGTQAVWVIEAVEMENKGTFYNEKGDD